ncbi:hypothetical protein DCC26_08090 [Auritidibacter sp. NML120779]|nr:hypothetical protein DCC26_08090 [Auritidibacter sp. NML120779]
MFEDDSRLKNIQLPREIDIVQARLQRCQDHIASFRSTWDKHLASRPHSVGMDIDEEGNGRLFLIRHKEPPLILSLFLGEFLYELRAALDNALYAVAIIDSGDNPPPKAEQLEWPICQSEEAWKRHRSRRLSALSKELQDDLYAIQPFNAEAPDWNCLAILNDMARLDRHRAVHFITSFASEGWMKHDKELVNDLEAFPGPIRSDGTFVTFRWLGDFEITPEYLDGETEFDVDVEGVTLTPGPNSSSPSRPWGSLAQRLQALHRAVYEYTYGLLDHAIELATTRNEHRRDSESKVSGD